MSLASLPSCAARFTRRYRIPVDGNATITNLDEPRRPPMGWRGTRPNPSRSATMSVALAELIAQIRDIEAA